MITRRTFLKASTAAAALTTLPGITKSLAANDPFMKLDATAQAELIRKGEVKSIELVEASIKRIEKLNPKLNAVITPTFDMARETATSSLKSGPFSGVPYAIKDLVDQKGVRTTNGSRLFLNHVAEQDSPSVASQLGTGLVSLGKTNTPEFGLLATTEPLAVGASRNPWNPDHSTGGSSGGAGAAVASGMVSMASASDGGGSIRIPASNCGLFGLKTSRFRTIAQNYPGPVQIGVRHVLSRSVRDSAIALHHTQNPDSGLATVPLMAKQNGDQKLKIALSMKSYSGTDPHADVKASIEATAKLCEGLGHTVEWAEPDYDREAFIHNFLVIWASGANGIVKMAQQATGKHPKETGLLEPWTIGLSDWFETLKGNPIEEAVTQFNQVTAQCKAFYENYDVSLTPVLSGPAQVIGDHAPNVDYDTLFQRTVDYCGYTPLANATGEPAMSVPLGWSKDGLPIGSQFHGGLGREEMLLNLAYQLEEAASWADKWPGMSTAL